MKHELKWSDLKGEETGALIYQLLSLWLFLGTFTPQDFWFDCDGTSSLPHAEKAPRQSHWYLQEEGFVENKSPTEVFLCI